jgi:hypothetical protein
MSSRSRLTLTSSIDAITDTADASRVPRGNNRNPHGHNLVRRPPQRFGGIAISIPPATRGSRRAVKIGDRAACLSVRRDQHGHDDPPTRRRSAPVSRPDARAGSGRRRDAGGFTKNAWPAAPGRPARRLDDRAPAGSPRELTGWSKRRTLSRPISRMSCRQSGWG